MGQTQIYCQEEEGAALLPIALLLQWPALPGGVSQRIITEAMPTGRQKSLVNSYTKTRDLTTLIINSVRNEELGKVFLVFGNWAKVTASEYESLCS